MVFNKTWLFNTKRFKYEKQMNTKYLKYETKVEYDLIKYETTFKIQKWLNAKWQSVQNEKSTHDNI